jgi:hypothetical protein
VDGWTGGRVDGWTGVWGWTGIDGSMDDPCRRLPTPPHAYHAHHCRQLLSCSWCHEQLHSYTANQLVLLRPHIASLVGERWGERLGERPPTAPPPPPPVRIERRRGGEVLRVLVEARVALAEVQEAAAAVAAAEAAVAAVRSAPADSDAVGERLSLLRLEPSPEEQPEHASVCQRQSQPRNGSGLAPSLPSAAVT